MILQGENAPFVGAIRHIEKIKTGFYTQYAGTDTARNSVATIVLQRPRKFPAVIVGTMELFIYIR